MEFFEYAEVTTQQEEIREKLHFQTLSTYCRDIDEVADEGEEDMVVYFATWGRFHIRCEQIMGGLRFSVPDCPNALAWTITTGYPPHPEKIVLHATINRTFHDPEFIEGIKLLLQAFKEGLETHFIHNNGSENREENRKALNLVDMR